MHVAMVPEGGIVVLECDAGRHAFHVACLATHVSTVEARRNPLHRVVTCPTCRSLRGFTDTTRRQIVVERVAAAIRARKDAEHAADLQLQLAWDAMPPALPVQPAPLVPRQLVLGAAGEWTAIDRFTALECVLSPCGHITKVPETLRTDWAIANTQVFDRIEQVTPIL